MKNLKALLLMVALPTYAAENIDFFAKKDVEYTSVVFKIKKEAKSGVNARSIMQNQQFILPGTTLQTIPLYDTEKKRKYNAASAMRLDEQYGFDRYYQIMLPGSKSTDIEYINHLLTQLSEEDIVEIAYPNAKPVVRDLSRPNTVKMAAKSGDILDFSAIQY
ncbi:hypothetical protein [Serratia symbiotica]|nr:hypothetical protein [Serratia symbiotica]